MPATCDGCGVAEADAEHGTLNEVIIQVCEGEEGGGSDFLDFCDPCLLERAPALVTAGSTAPWVAGRCGKAGGEPGE